MRRLLRPRVVIGTLVGLITFYAFFGFVLVPYVIKSYVVPSVSEQVKHPILLREAAFNPFALSLRLTGLEVHEQNDAPMVGFEELFVNVRAVTLLFQKVAFDEIRLVMPFVAARVNSEGKLNLLSLVPPSDGTAPPPTQPSGERKSLMPLQIDLLEIGRGIVEYRDDSKSRPIVMDVVPFEIMLRNFSTVPIEGRENAHAFTAEIGKGEQISWEGTIFLEPIESDGRINLSGIKLKTLHQVLRDVVQFDIQQGVLGLSVPYHFDLRGETAQTIVKNGKLSIDNLAIVERGGIDPIITVPKFGVEGVQLDLQKQIVDVTKVHSADARFDAALDADGVLNLQSLFAPVEGGGGTTTSAPVKNESNNAAKPWSVSVDEVVLRNYAAAFEDRTLPRPGHVDVTGMDVTVKEVAIPWKKPLPVNLSMKVNETGSINVKGKVSVEPLSADTDLTLDHIELRPFQPYADRFLNADILDGAIDLAGVLHFAKEHGSGPLMQFAGNVAVTQLAISDRKDLDDVLTWKALNVNRIALDVEPTAVKIGEVVWQQPSLQVIMGADGQLNLSRLAVAPPPGDQASRAQEREKVPAKTSDPVPVTIDQVKVVKLAATFQDLSVEPKVRTSLTDFGGTIKGLSSKQLKKADVNLKGKIGRAAPLKVVGKVNPLSENAFTDLVITLGGMDLTPGSAYSGKFVGYGLSKGKLSLDLKYKVSQKVLEAENLVHVDQLTFGEKTNSPDATSLPVPLVVALLKDRKGMIEIDMPIRGNLNDPDFRYGKVVISTLLNLLTKVVASPFSLMGKLVPGGGSEEDLQFIGFQPGSASLADEDTKKLEALETALEERAGLRLDIKGTFDTTLDRAALQQAKLRERLVEMSGLPRGAANADQPALSAREEQRLIEKLYARIPPADRTSTTQESSQPTVEEMKQKVAASIAISEAEFEALAKQRAEGIRTRLIENGKLTEERIALQDTGAAESGHERIRTQLSLSAGVAEPTGPSE